MKKNETLLNDLIFQAKEHLRELNYSNQTIKTYRLIWQRFSDFAKNESQPQYSREIVNRFLDQYYGISDLGYPKTKFDGMKVRAMKILEDIKNTDRIRKKYGIRSVGRKQRR